MIYGDIGRIASISHCKAPTPNSLLRWVNCVPTATNVRFEPSMQIHRHKPVKESNYQAGGDANAAA
jgi:hypothetical protein